MATPQTKQADQQRQTINHNDEDPVLAGLDQAKTHYRKLRTTLEHQLEELAETQKEMQRAQKRAGDLREKLAATQRKLQDEQKQAARQKERADHLAELLRDVHRSIFGGNIYDLILKACLHITGATRGLYITARGSKGDLRVRAAVDIDGYPNHPPSPFLSALCRKVLEDGETFVCHEQTDMSELPHAAAPGEQFANCIVAPVVLLKNLDGILLVADKTRGDFDADDVQTLMGVGNQAAVAVENAQLQRALQSAYLSTISMLADAVEAKDPYTHGHCELVSRYARLIAGRLNLPEHDRNVVCYAALLHDVGKIGISDGLINKPGPLTPEERELVRSHVRVGHDLLCHVPALEVIADAVLHHHEWFDGSGYPDGLSGSNIPIASRIVAVVDAYCAMITKRSYKEAYTSEQACEELRNCAKQQFDPEVVEVFLQVLDSPEAQDQDADFDAECGLLPSIAQQRHKEKPSG